MTPDQDWHEHDFLDWLEANRHAHRAGEANAYDDGARAGWIAAVRFMYAVRNAAEGLKARASGGTTYTGFPSAASVSETPRADGFAAKPIKGSMNDWHRKPRT